MVIEIDACNSKAAEVSSFLEMFGDERSLFVVQIVGDWITEHGWTTTVNDVLAMRAELRKAEKENAVTHVDCIERENAIEPESLPEENINGNLFLQMSAFSR